MRRKHTNGEGQGPRRLRRGSVPAILGLAGIATVALTSFGGAAAPLGHARLSARAGRAQVPYGKGTSIRGVLRATGPASNRRISLQSDPYPFGHWSYRTSTTTGADGTYAFRVHPDRNTRYRAVLSDAHRIRSDPAAVVVNDAARTTVKPVRLGRVRIEIAAHHPADLRWSGHHVYWYVGRRRSNLHSVARRESTRFDAQETRMKAVLPIHRAGRFHFAACLDARSRRALGAPGSHPSCAQGEFRGGRRAEWQGHGHAPFGFPTRRDVARAKGYLAGRSGVTAFAAVTSEGRVYGSQVHERFITASVVKAMLLVAYLRKLDHEHRALDSNDRSILDPMIHVSDNSAATRAYDFVGDPGLYDVARLAGMRDFSVSGYWANAMLTASDQARYFFGMNRLIPKQFRHYAAHLLSHIVDYESWGIPAVARPRGWTVYFKGGWRTTDRGQLVHQIARLKREHERIAIAVMTDGDPSMTYGIDTIQGVTRKLTHGK
jgi:hypothetical protein